MNKYKILIVLSICYLVTACNQNKVEGVNSKLFQNESYKKNKLEYKLFFLDSLFEISNKMSNDTVRRNFLFDLSAEYYYLNYKNKKHTKKVIDDEIHVIKENEELDNNDFELSNHTKKLNELIDEVIIIMNKMKSLN